MELRITNYQLRMTSDRVEPSRVRRQWLVHNWGWVEVCIGDRVIGNS